MHTFSFGELALIFGIVIVLFGGSRLASVGKSLGEGIANFKKGLASSNQDEQPAIEHNPSSPRNKSSENVENSEGRPNSV